MAGRITKALARPEAAAEMAQARAALDDLIGAACAHLNAFSDQMEANASALHKALVADIGRQLGEALLRVPDRCPP